MIRALRRARLAPIAAAVALFATMPITVSSLLHSDGDDIFCHEAVVIHDAASHEIGAATEAVPDSQHCVLCHVLQSLRAIGAAIRVTTPDEHAATAAAISSDGCLAPVASTRPARAPPSI